MTSLCKKKRKKEAPAKPQSTQVVAQEQIPISRDCIRAKQPSASAATSVPTQKFSRYIPLPRNM